MTPSPAVKFESLSEELLLQITGYALRSSQEHATFAFDGYYNPCQFDIALFDVSKSSRRVLEDALPPFIEIYDHPCLEHGALASRYYATHALSNAQHGKLRHLRDNGQLNINTIRLDMWCTNNCALKEGPERLLAFTEATLFASVLAALLIKANFRRRRVLEVQILPLAPNSHRLLESVCVRICRYLCPTKMRQDVSAINEEISQSAINININCSYPLPDFANLLHYHTINIQNMLTSGTPVHTLVPVAWQFIQAFRPIMWAVGRRVDRDTQPMVTYIQHLYENNTNIMLRGAAAYQLQRSANHSHYVLDSAGGDNFSNVLKSFGDIVQAREHAQLRALAASLFPDQAITHADVKKRLKVEQIHKSLILIFLATARIITLRRADLPEISTLR